MIFQNATLSVGALPHQANSGWMKEGSQRVQLHIERPIWIHKGMILMSNVFQQ